MDAYVSFIIQDTLEMIQNPNVGLWINNPEFSFCSCLFIITKYFVYVWMEKTKQQTNK